MTIHAPAEPYEAEAHNSCLRCGERWQARASIKTACPACDGILVAWLNHPLRARSSGAIGVVPCPKPLLAFNEIVVKKYPEIGQRLNRREGE